MTRQQLSDLPGLLKAVVSARSEVEDARHRRAVPGHTVAVLEQRSLMAALESYSSALTHNGSPIPYRLHNELAMYHAMFSIRRGGKVE